ncbi:MAG: M24 family metallopeptidase, partial [Anaerolineae bacterium]
SWQLTAGRFVAIQNALPDLKLVDCSTLVSAQRVIKSPAEIGYQRLAGKAAEAGMQAAIETAIPGNSERVMAAAISEAMILAGSDRPGPGVLSTGERAFHLHGGYSDRILKAGDHVQVETTPNVRYYHARFMRPIKAGHASQEDHDLVSQLADIQDQALAEIGPGVHVSIPDKLYRDGVLQAGLAESYTNKTFYSVGLMFDPTSGEPLEATAVSDWEFQAGMVLHTYVLARGFGISETITVDQTGIERLTNFPRKLFVAN